MKFKGMFLFTYSSLPGFMKRVLLSTENFWISLCLGEAFWGKDCKVCAADLSVSAYYWLWLKLSELLPLPGHIHFLGFPTAFPKGFVFFYKSLCRMKYLWVSMTVEGGTHSFTVLLFYYYGMLKIYKSPCF